MKISSAASRSAFSYSVAHALRAPLRTMNGFAGILLDHADRLDHEAIGYLRRIQANAMRMGSSSTRCSSSGE